MSYSSQDKKLLATASVAMIIIGYYLIKNNSKNILNNTYYETENTSDLLDSKNIEYFYLSTPDEENIPVKELSIVETIKNFFSKSLTLDEIDSILSNQNMIAFLRLIRVGEGTSDSGGYTRLFGGQQFTGFSDHPRILIKRGALKSTAAGAYQILSRTWDDIKKSNSFLIDFTPENQDRAAVALIARRGAINDILDGNFSDAIYKTNKEWASLPASPYGQPTLTFGRAFKILADNGATANVG